MSRHVAVLVDMFASRKADSSDVILKHHSEIRSFFDQKELPTVWAEFGDQILGVVDADTGIVDLPKMLVEFADLVERLRTCATAATFECEERIEQTTGIEPPAVRHALEELQQVMVCVPPGHFVLNGSFEDAYGAEALALTWNSVTLTEDGRGRPIRLAAFSAARKSKAIPNSDAPKSKPILDPQAAMSTPILDPDALVTACIAALDILVHLRGHLEDRDAKYIAPFVRCWAIERDRRSPQVVRDQFADGPLRLNDDIRRSMVDAIELLQPFATESAPGILAVGARVEEVAKKLGSKLSSFQSEKPALVFDLMETSDYHSLSPIVRELQMACHTAVEDAISAVASLLTASRHGIMDSERYEDPEA